MLAYIYSGAIAASAYVTLCSFAECIRRVILLSPAHRVAVRGLVLPNVDAFTSPLGRMMIDTAAITNIIHLPQVTVSPQAHVLEHSLEVQLPFLQSTLTDFSIVPLVVGMASAEEVAEVLDCLWGSEETLIIVSSDLSHYLPYAIAQREDSKTVSSILQLNQSVDHEHACGAIPINGLVLAARKHHLTPHLLDLRNSGDTAGPREQVVGYGAFVFTLPYSSLGNTNYAA
jgi:AmmeMemoRadiSam system protein B